MRYLIFILLPVFCFGQQTVILKSKFITSPVVSDEYAIEGGTTAKFKFSIGFDPVVSSKVFFEYDTSKITLTPDTLTYTTANYNTSQTVTITRKTRTNTWLTTGVDTTNVVFRIKNSNYTNAYAGKVRMLTVSPNFSATNDYHGVVKIWDTSAIKYNVENDFHYTGASNLNALRQTVISSLYPVTNQLPTTGVDSIYTNVALNGRYQLYCDPSNFQNLQQMNVYVVNYAGYKQFFYHMIPKVRRNKVVLFSGGHGLGAGIEAWNFPNAGVQVDDNNYPLLAYHLNANGYDVVFSQMPLMGLNSGPHSLHNEMAPDTTSTFNPMSVFVDGWVRVKNYLSTAMTVNRWISTGLSGGGWTCTMLSAIVPSIDISFAVSGSTPIYAKNFVNDADYTGDYEQGGISGTNTYTLFHNSYSYEDLYVLAAQNRKHYQLLNITDNCCFWGRFWQTWILPVKAHASAANGVYDVFEFQAPYHQYTQTVVDYILGKLK